MTLKQYLKHKNMTQSDFAKIAGYDYRTVWHWVHGKSPSRKNAARIIEVTGGKVTLKDLLSV